jgi:predicted esterase
MKKEIKKFSLEIDHEIHTLETQNPKKLLVLLHGHMLDGSFMLRKYSRYIKEGYKIIAPNAPFLVPMQKGETWVPRYTWYYYKSEDDSFHIDPMNATKYTLEVIKEHNPDNLPIEIIGYSQGGFFAPKLAEFLDNIETIIGISCIFKKSRYKIKPEITYHQIHGDKDSVVSYDDAKLKFQDIKAISPKSTFTTIECDHLLQSELVKASIGVLKGN